MSGTDGRNDPRSATLTNTSDAEGAGNAGIISHINEIVNDSSYVDQISS